MYPQAHQPYAYGVNMADMYLESYYIVSDQHGSEDVPKWYLSAHDEKLNRVVWVAEMKKAREFHSKQEAIDFAKKTNRKYTIEEVEEFCF